MGISDGAVDRVGRTRLKLTRQRWTKERKLHRWWDPSEKQATYSYIRYSQTILVSNTRLSSHLCWLLQREIMIAFQERVRTTYPNFAAAPHWAFVCCRQTAAIIATLWTEWNKTCSIIFPWVVDFLIGLFCSAFRENMLFPASVFLSTSETPWRQTGATLESVSPVWLCFASLKPRLCLLVLSNITCGKNHQM